jgi:hypothetical protein
MTNEELLRKINKQLQAIKVMLVLFLVAMLAAATAFGLIAYRGLQAVNNLDTKLSALQRTATPPVDIKSQVCSNASLRQLLPLPAC